MNNYTSNNKTNETSSLIRLLVIFLFLIFLLIYITSSLFTVGKNQAVAVRRFGEIVRIETEPGLHIKSFIPFIYSTQTTSTAIRLYDIPSSEIITKDKKTMITDCFVFWSVSDPKTFIKALGNADARANERVDAVVYNSIKNYVSSLTQEELISFRGDTLSNKVIEECNASMQTEYGITIVEAQIKALTLPTANEKAVFERMISERNNISAKYTAEGKAEAQIIRNETDKNIAMIKADAERQAEILRAEGEAEYMRILSEAYNDEDKAEFYSFIRSLDALENSLSTGNKTIMLDKDSELVQILYGMN